MSLDKESEKLMDVALCELDIGADYPFGNDQSSQEDILFDF